MMKACTAVARIFAAGVLMAFAGSAVAQQAEIAMILTMPEVKEKLGSQGMEPFISTPDQFAARMKADMAKFARVIKAINIKIEN